MKVATPELFVISLFLVNTVCETLRKLIVLLRLYQNKQLDPLISEYCQAISAVSGPLSSVFLLVSSQVVLAKLFFLNTVDSECNLFEKVLQCLQITNQLRQFIELDCQIDHASDVVPIVVLTAWREIPSCLQEFERSVITCFDTVTAKVTYEMLTF
jgi:hypothetical protein